MAYTCNLGSSLGTSTTFSSGTNYSSVRFKCSVNLGVVSGYITFYGNHSHSSTVSNTITINNSSGILSSPGFVDIYVSNFDTSKEHTFSIAKTSTSYTVTLTAEFEPLTGKITYDKNGGTGGPSSGSTTIGGYYTIPTTIPTKSGYSFVDWESDETGWSYDPGEKTLVYESESDFPSWPSTSPILYNDTLIAQWLQVFTITYNANGGKGAPGPQTKKYGESINLSSVKPTKDNTTASSFVVTFDPNGGTCTTKTLSATRTTSYTFNKWTTAQNGSGSSYNSGAQYKGNANLTLYAQYTSSTATSSIILPTASRTGYTFQGWATISTATSGQGANTSYTPPKTITLYAIWKINTYTVTYNGNGGKTSANKTSITETVNYGTKIDLTSKNPKDFKYTGYNFIGWGNSSNAISPPSNTATITAKKTYYAIWELASNIRVYTNGSWKIAIPYIYKNGSWSISLSKIYNNEEWRL